VLKANVEKRVAALKSSTQINGFQRLFFRLHFSEANASGMVSSFPTSFVRLAMVHFSWPRECMVLGWMAVTVRHVTDRMKTCG
jgi:hypothetical protein